MEATSELRSKLLATILATEHLAIFKVQNCSRCAIAGVSVSTYAKLYIALLTKIAVLAVLAVKLLLRFFSFLFFSLSFLILKKMIFFIIKQPKDHHMHSIS